MMFALTLLLIAVAAVVIAVIEHYENKHIPLEPTPGRERVGAPPADWDWPAK